MRWTPPLKIHTQTHSGCPIRRVKYSFSSINPEEDKELDRLYGRILCLNCTQHCSLHFCLAFTAIWTRFSHLLYRDIGRYDCHMFWLWMIYKVMKVKGWRCAYLPLTYKKINWLEADVYQHYVVLCLLRFLMCTDVSELAGPSSNECNQILKYLINQNLFTTENENLAWGITQLTFTGNFLVLNLGPDTLFWVFSWSSKFSPGKCQETYLNYTTLDYLLTYSTPWSTAVLETLTGSHPVRKFPVYYETRRSITPFTSARYLSLFWASSMQSMPPHITSWR